MDNLNSTTCSSSPLAGRRGGHRVREEIGRRGTMAVVLVFGGPLSFVMEIEMVTITMHSYETYPSSYIKFESTSKLRSNPHNFFIFWECVWAHVALRGEAYVQVNPRWIEAKTANSKQQTSKIQQRSIPREQSARVIHTKNYLTNHIQTPLLIFYTCMKCERTTFPMTWISY